MVFTALLNGLSHASLLFVIASGLTLIFGLMGVVNFAHGAFYMLGAYFALLLGDVLPFGEIFWIALLVAPFIVAGLGILIEYFTIRPLYPRDPIYQVLLTFGVAITIEEIVVLIAGTDSRRVSPPEAFSGVADLSIAFYPKYRLLVIALGTVIGILLWVFLRYTKTGIIIRAGTTHSEMVEALGINIRRQFTVMFGIGVLLAAMGGIMAAPLVGAYPLMGTSIIIEAFIVVIVGGLGSVRGSVIGALIIGMAQSLGAFYIDQFVGVVMFVVMIAVLLIRPNGIFGQQGVFEH